MRLIFNGYFMNHFEFYNIPVSFKVDEAAVKKTFYANSRKYHPDFFTREGAEKQAEILQLSTLNNEAYNVLSDADKRMKYMLHLKGVLGAEGNAQLPGDFLAEMMDVNESLMELEFDFDRDAYNHIKYVVAETEKTLDAEIQPVVDAYADDKAHAADLEAIKNYYLKKRYLLRIQENLSTFAAL